MTATRTILRRFPEGDVIAIFPDVDEGGGRVSSYMHVGQHGPTDPGIVGMTSPVDALEPDAAALLRELESIGYVPRVIRRFPARSNPIR
jgi:hypothetical protein